MPPTYMVSENMIPLDMSLSKPSVSSHESALRAASHDFRSDTITGLHAFVSPRWRLTVAPTAEMLQAMVKTATYADDIYGRDPCTVMLEAEVAKLTGMEDALFTLSGTMGNQICLRTHLMQPPHSILCDERTHVYALEAGGPALLSQAMTVLCRPSNGRYLTLEDVKDKIIGEDVHFAPTKIVSLENTINGVVLPYAEAKRISDYVRSEYKGEIKMHLDGILHGKELELTIGARLWHGVVAEGITVKQYCSLFDSVSLCFSKGLSTPVGTVIAGTAPFIKKARHFKKLFGGGVRNPGILTSACLIALKTTLPKLAGTHKIAKEIADAAEEMGYKLTLPVDTNFVFLDLDDLGVSRKTFQQYCVAEGVSVLESNRIAVHHQITKGGVARLLNALSLLMNDVKTGQVKHVRPDVRPRL